MQRWGKLPSTHILPTARFRISQSGGLEPPPGLTSTHRQTVADEEVGWCPEEEEEEEELCRSTPGC